MKNQTKNTCFYGKNEFCKSMSCSWLHPKEKTCADKEGNCAYSAKEFHKWLKENNYRIIKDE